MNITQLKSTLESVRHELTTLEGLIAADGQAPSQTWPLSFSSLLESVDESLRILQSEVTDSERLNWLESTHTGVNYNVECCRWGVDYEAPHSSSLRGAIDVARALESPSLTWDSFLQVIAPRSSSDLWAESRRSEILKRALTPSITIPELLEFMGLLPSDWTSEEQTKIQDFLSIYR
jgi:hypothetical protein